MSGPGVYFISPEGDDVIKIGSTESLRSRLKALQTGSPRPLHVRLFVKPSFGESSLDIERVFHSRFSEYRMEGEWFRLDGELERFLDANSGYAYCPCSRCVPGGTSRCSLCDVTTPDCEQNLYLVDPDGNGYCDDCIYELEGKALKHEDTKRALERLMSTAIHPEGVEVYALM